MRLDKAQIDLIHHHRKGKRIGSNVSFEQNSEVPFTAIMVNISINKGEKYAF